jgi:hypothetical protein
MTTELTRTRVNTARVIAMLADGLQLVVFPAFIEGYLSPFEDVLDMIVAAIMCGLLGFHWGFLPSFIAKLIPGLDLIPTWTAAVFLVTGLGTPKPAQPPIDVSAVPVSPVEPPRIESPKP